MHFGKLHRQTHSLYFFCFIIILVNRATISMDIKYHITVLIVFRSAIIMINCLTLYNISNKRTLSIPNTINPIRSLFRGL